MKVKPNPPDAVLVRDVAKAIRSVAVAASERLGADCILHAMMACHLLRRAGTEAKFAAGYAAWRIGTTPGAVVAHHPGGDIIEAPGNALIFHAWVSLDSGRWIFDPTGYQLPGKMASIDAYDGQVTPISMPEDWEDGLLLPRTDTSTWESVRDGATPGLACYERQPAITRMITEHPDSKLVAHDVAIVETAFDVVRSGSSLMVFGPESGQSAEERIRCVAAAR